MIDGSGSKFTKSPCQKPSRGLSQQGQSVQLVATVSGEGVERFGSSIHVFDGFWVAMCKHMLDLSVLCATLGEKKDFIEMFECFARKSTLAGNGRRQPPRGGERRMR